MKSILDLKPQEGRTAVLLLVHYFGLGVALACFYPAASAIFLDSFGASRLSYAYIGAAAVIAIAGAGYARLERRVSTGRLFSLTVQGMLVSIVGLRAGLWLFPGPVVVFATLMWSQLLTVFISIEFWGLAGRIFNVREAKRIFPLIASGADVAYALGCFSVPVLVPLIGTPNLLLVSAGGIVIALLALRVILREKAEQLAAGDEGGDEEDEASDDPSHEKPPSLFRSRYFVLLSLLVTLSQLCYYLLDFSFLSQVQVRYPGQDELSKFLGLLFGSITVVNLILKPIVGTRLLARYGITAGLLVLPCFVFGGALGIVVAGIVPGAVTAVFLATAATRCADELLRTAIDNPCFPILYQPLRPAVRLRVQVAIEAVVLPVATALPGLVILSLAALGSERMVGPVLLASVGAWIVVSRLVTAAYVEALKDALSGRTLLRSKLSLDDASTVKVLRHKLSSAHPGEVMYAIDLLETVAHDELPTTFLGLLGHSSPDVRTFALGRIERHRFAVATEHVRRAVSGGESAPVRAAALRALAAVDPSAVEEVAAYLDDASPAVRVGAIVGLLRTGAIEGVILAGERVLALASSTDPAERVLAARVLAEVGVSSFYRPLLKLLSDPDRAVRRAANEAAAVVKNARLGPLLLENLGRAGPAASAVTALAALGEDVLPVVGARLQGELAIAADGDLACRLARICGRIGGRGTEILRRAIPAAGPDLRGACIEGLAAAGYTAGAEEAASVREWIEGELRHCAWTIAARLDLGSCPEAALLGGALEQSLRDSRDRLLLLLSFLYAPETLRRVRRILDSGSEESQAYAIELIDTVLPHELRDRIRPLIEKLAPAEALAALDPAQPRLERTPRLLAVVNREDPLLSSWTRAAAIHAGCVLEVAALRKPLEILAATRPDELVSETARYGLELLSRTAARMPLEVSMMYTIERVLLLKSVSIFLGTPDDVLAHIASVLKEETFAAGAPIFAKGDVSDAMYFVIDGEVHIHDGDRSVARLGARELFGEMGLLDPEPRSASVTALKKTLVCKLAQDDFYDIMADRIEVARGVIRVLCHRLRSQIQAPAGR
jgi:hypothetical protein